MSEQSRPTKAYKILTPSEWSSWNSDGTFSGAGIDVKDGYIHLSTDQQVLETYEKYFKGSDVVLVTVDLTKVTDEVKWESSRNGQLFPHVYGKLGREAVVDYTESWDGSQPSI